MKIAEDSLNFCQYSDLILILDVLAFELNFAFFFSLLVYLVDLPDLKKLTVEAALIHSAPTVKNNTASTSVSNNELVAPIICKSTRFNWTQLSRCVPDLPLKAVPWYKRRFFGNPVIHRPPRHLRSDATGTPVAHSTRSRRRPRSSLGNAVSI